MLTESIRSRTRTFYGDVTS